jgi:cbb3-type cytochrome oxidase maturation protein
MALGIWLIVLWMAFMVLVGIVLFVWGWRRGQFRDVEASKIRMLEDPDPEPWPRKARSARAREGGEIA